MFFWFIVVFSVLNNKLRYKKQKVAIKPIFMKITMLKMAVSQYDTAKSQIIYIGFNKNIIITKIH